MYCFRENSNFPFSNRLFHAGRRALRRERVFRDRTKPLDIYDDFELIDKYRFSRQSIMLICDMLQDDLESSTFRNRALIPNMKVFVALRFYASGSFQGTHLDYRNHLSRVQLAMYLQHW
jgi:hypothetical protein